MCLAGDWRLRRGSAVQSGSVPIACTSHVPYLPRYVVAPLPNSRETLFYTVIIQRLFGLLL